VTAAFMNATKCDERGIVSCGGGGGGGGAIAKFSELTPLG